MSYKIIDQIKKLKGMPRKYKSVLEAWASFANKDGSGIRPSKVRVAERAGISRWTVNRHTEDLVAFGVLVKTGRHYYGNGHWTTTYMIDVPKLLEIEWDKTVATSQNATLDESEQRSKMPNEQRSKMHQTNVAKCAAILPSDPAALTPNDDPSVSSETVIEKKEGRNREVLAPLAPATLPIPDTNEGSNQESKDVVAKWYELLPGVKAQPDDMDAATRLVQEHGTERVLKLMPVIIHDMAHIIKGRDKQPVAWRDLRTFAKVFEFNAARAEAWLRASEAKAETKAKADPKPAKKTCKMCGYPASLDSEDGDYCSVHDKLPSYRKASNGFYSIGADSVCCDCGRKGVNVADYPRCQDCLDAMDELNEAAAAKAAGSSMGGYTVADDAL